MAGRKIDKRYVCKRLISQQRSLGPSQSLCVPWFAGFDGEEVDLLHISASGSHGRLPIRSSTAAAHLDNVMAGSPVGQGYGHSIATATNHSYHLSAGPCCYRHQNCVFSPPPRKESLAIEQLADHLNGLESILPSRCWTISGIVLSLLLDPELKLGLDI